MDGRMAGRDAERAGVREGGTRTVAGGEAGRTPGAARRGGGNPLDTPEEFGEAMRAIETLRNANGAAMTLCQLLTKWLGAIHMDTDERPALSGPLRADLARASAMAADTIGWLSTLMKQVHFARAWLAREGVRSAGHLAATPWPTPAPAPDEAAVAAVFLALHEQSDRIFIRPEGQPPIRLSRGDADRVHAIAQAELAAKKAQEQKGLEKARAEHAYREGIDRSVQRLGELERELGLPAGSMGRSPSEIGEIDQVGRRVDRVA